MDILDLMREQECEDLLALREDFARGEFVVQGIEQERKVARAAKACAQVAALLIFVETGKRYEFCKFCGRPVAGYFNLCNMPDCVECFQEEFCSAKQ